MGKRKAVMLAEGAQRQTLTDLLLIDRVDIVGITRVYGHCQTRIGYRLHREGLGFPRQLAVAGLGHDEPTILITRR